MPGQPKHPCAQQPQCDSRPTQTSVLCNSDVWMQFMYDRVSKSQLRKQRLKSYATTNRIDLPTNTRAKMHAFSHSTTHSTTVRTFKVGVDSESCGEQRQCTAAHLHAQHPTNQNTARAANQTHEFSNRYWPLHTLCALSCACFLG
jgi:hypothetical protein